MQAPQPPVRVLLLGDFAVARPDGTVVEPGEWRTGKTMDLFRLLALRNGRPVRAEGLVEKLWPVAPPERARASLRTATSQIRRVLGPGSVVRQREGLMLHGAMVDAVAFREAHRRVGVAVAAARHHEVVTLAVAAEQVYRGDFHAYDDDSEWCWTEREQLRLLRHELLCDAATSALRLRRHREALRFARTAHQVDPSSEIANRLLMQAHGAAGEVSSGLRIFQSYRARLAEELGADPSPQTQAVYLELLRGVTEHSR